MLHSFQVISWFNELLYIVFEELEFTLQRNPANYDNEKGIMSFKSGFLFTRKLSKKTSIGQVEIIPSNILLMQSELVDRLEIFVSHVTTNYLNLWNNNPALILMLPSNQRFHRICTHVSNNMGATCV